MKERGGFAHNEGAYIKYVTDMSTKPTKLFRKRIIFTFKISLENWIFSRFCEAVSRTARARIIIRNRASKRLTKQKPKKTFSRLFFHGCEELVICFCHRHLINQELNRV